MQYIDAFEASQNTALNQRVRIALFLNAQAEAAVAAAWATFAGVI
jgi:hypothetical protein